MSSHPVGNMASGSLPIIIRIAPSGMPRDGLGRGRKRPFNGRTLKLNTDSEHLTGDRGTVVSGSTWPDEEYLYPRRREYHPPGVDACIHPPTRLDISGAALRPAAWPVVEPIMPRKDAHLPQMRQQGVERARTLQSIIPGHPHGI